MTVDFPDETVIANEIMAERSDDLLFDEAERSALADEIREIVDQIRELEPRLESIGPPPHSPYISMPLRGDAAEVFLDRAHTTSAKFSASRTGQIDIDALSQTLGARAFLINVHLPTQSVDVRICQSSLVNTPVAVAAYEDLESTEFAEADVFGGDSSAFNMRQFDDRWYVVFREGGGDCLVGCTTEDLWFFIVDGDELDEVGEEEAARDQHFAEVVALARWARPDAEWP